VEEAKAEPVIATNNFSTQFKLLLESGSHSDIVFLVGDDSTPVLAHKAILSAR
jgi:phage protein D